MSGVEGSYFVMFAKSSRWTVIISVLSRSVHYLLLHLWALYEQKNTVRLRWRAWMCFFLFYVGSDSNFIAVVSMCLFVCLECVCTDGVVRCLLTVVCLFAEICTCVCVCVCVCVCARARALAHVYACFLLFFYRFNDF